MEGYVEHDNNVRLSRAVGCIAPKDMLAGRQAEIPAERDRKREAARQQRQIRRVLAVYTFAAIWISRFAPNSEITFSQPCLGAYQVNDEGMRLSAES